MGDAHILLWAHKVMRHLIDTCISNLSSYRMECLSKPPSPLEQTDTAICWCATQTRSELRNKDRFLHDASFNMPVPTLHTEQVIYISFFSSKMCSTRGWHARRLHANQSCCATATDPQRPVFGWLMHVSYMYPFLTSPLEPPPLHLATQTEKLR